MCSEARNRAEHPKNRPRHKVTSMHKSRSLILMGAAVVAAALFLMPSVAAQGGAPTSQITVQKVGVPAVPIKPQIENPAFTVDFTYSLSNPALSTTGTATSNVPVTMNFQCQNGVTVTGSSVVIVPINAGATGSFAGKGNFQISVPRTAPGLQALPCNLKISAGSPNAAVPPVPEQTVPFTVTADYYSVNQVKLASKLKQSGPQKQVPFEMEVTNFGNARTQYTFEIGVEPSKGKWNAILPEVLLLESPNSGQGSPTNTAVFTVATPFKNGWNNEEGAYQIVVKPSSADDPTKVGNPLTANMLVRVRGVYVPGLEPFVMLAAILGSALVLRLRKEE
jgi:hypothetical protein